MKYTFLLAMMFLMTSLHAQDFNPVKWQFTLEKNQDKSGYTLLASATVEKEWHVFAPDPGGDGLLIPTEVVIEEPKGLKIGAILPSRRPISKEMDGIGMVNYYEGEITFTLAIDAEKITSLTGKASFQCCNDKMCLPPRDIPFSLKP